MNFRNHYNIISATQVDNLSWVKPTLLFVVFGRTSSTIIKPISLALKCAGSQDIFIIPAKGFETTLKSCTALQKSFVKS